MKRRHVLELGISSSLAMLIPKIAEATDSADIDRLIDSLPFPKMPPDPPDKPTILPETEKKTYVGANRCIAGTAREGVSTFQAAAFAPNSDVLWPGSIIDGNSILDGSLTPITVARAPATIIIDSIGNPPATGAIPPITTRIASPSLPTVLTNVRALIAKNIPLGAPARIAQSIIEYSSEGQAAIKLNAAAKWMTGNLRAGLAVDSLKKQDNYVIQFVQSYYDLVFTPPGLPSDLFGKGVAARDIRRRLGSPAVRPAYVSTVTFGRILLLRVSTTEDRSTTQAYLNLIVSGLTASGELEAQFLKSEFVKRAEFNLLLLGGPSEAGVALLKGAKGLTELPKYYKAGINLNQKNPGVPISYKLRWLGSNQIARMTFTTDYQSQTCAPQDIKRFGIRFQTLDDDKDRGDIVTGEIFLNNVLVWRWAEFGRREHTWNDNTHQPEDNDAGFGGVPGWFSAPPSVPGLKASDCSGLKVRITKIGNKGWNFKYQAALWLDDGTPNGKMVEFMRAPTPANFKGGEQMVEYAANAC